MTKTVFNYNLCSCKGTLFDMVYHCEEHSFETKERRNITQMHCKAQKLQHKSEHGQSVMRVNELQHNQEEQEIIVATINGICETV